MPSPVFRTIHLKIRHFFLDLWGSESLQNPRCDILLPHSHLHTQARSIIQMSDEQYSQYVGMLYCVDLNMWPLCSSTCREQQSKGSFGVYLHMSFHIYVLYSGLWCFSIVLLQRANGAVEDWLLVTMRMKTDLQYRRPFSCVFCVQV